MLEHSPLLWGQVVVVIDTFKMQKLYVQPMSHAGKFFYWIINASQFIYTLYPQGVKENVKLNHRENISPKHALGTELKKHLKKVHFLIKLPWTTVTGNKTRNAVMEKVIHMPKPKFSRTSSSGAASCLVTFLISPWMTVARSLMISQVTDCYLCISVPSHIIPCGKSITDYMEPSLSNLYKPRSLSFQIGCFLQF